MSKAKTHYYLIAREQLTGARVESVLDMLRYDYARIESNAPEGFYLLSADHPPEVARWASFHIQVAWVGTDRADALQAAASLRQGAR